MTIYSLKKRFLRDRMRRELHNKVETRDAILWDVIPEQKLCRVKFQGSDNLVECKYPENIEQTPRWLKPGTSVKVNHRSGNKHSFEVISHGLFVPTPTINSETGLSNPAGPTIAPGVDTVLIGCLVKALSDVQAMKVYVQTGTYRIGGIFYSLTPMLMTDDNIADMSMGVPFDITQGVYEINAAHATLWRMDRLVTAADHVVDVLVGDNAVNEPDPPDVPSNHVSLGTVLIPPGFTAIDDTLINRTYEDPAASLINVSIADSDLTWTEETTSITLTLLDQYGNPLLGTYVSVLCSITSGSGILSTSNVAISTTTGQATLTYTREDGYAESSGNIENGPIWLNFVLSNNSLISMIATITIYNELGEPIL